MAGSRWLDEREARVWRAFLDLHREVEIACNRELVRNAGLSGSDYALLVPLSEAPDGLLRARELGAVVRWERSRLSHQVTRMEKRGLVAREECASDARGAMVRLTPAGRAAIEAAAPQHVETVRRVFFDPLASEDLDTLGSVFDRLLRGLAEENAGCSAQDPCTDEA